MIKKSEEEEAERLKKEERQKILAETDIYQESFKRQLKEFCHYYQIPFLENNIPKSCKNAAKIYRRMKDDKVKISKQFDDLENYLKSIPPEEIQENFDPTKMKEKWMKFFRSGFSRILVDTDRALKNDINESLKLFITDTKNNFTDRQLIRALLILAKNSDLKVMKEKDKIL